MDKFSWPQGLSDEQLFRWQIRQTRFDAFVVVFAAMYSHLEHIENVGVYLPNAT